MLVVYTIQVATLVSQPQILEFTLQIGENPDQGVSGQKGVGISSFGEIIASGVVTATTFTGNLIRKCNW